MKVIGRQPLRGGSKNPKMGVKATKLSIPSLFVINGNSIYKINLNIVTIIPAMIFSKIFKPASYVLNHFRIKNYEN